MKDTVSKLVIVQCASERREGGAKKLHTLAWVRRPPYYVTPRGDISGYLRTLRICKSTANHPEVPCKTVNDECADGVDDHLPARTVVEASTAVMR